MKHQHQSDEPMIAIADLSVRYGALHAVRGLSLSVARGEVFGMLGPNGAGKSSALACVSGLTLPDAGSVRVAGYDVVRDPTPVKALLGVQLQRSALFAELTLRELVQLYAARQASPGFAHPPDTPWQREMEDAFVFTETHDQLTAIDEVK
ncbi:MAG TPA: ATP-binding cassette domain-containing protein, partial [Chloroflexaceae bacterium]|nr:ATP-binding cassette domain-containing protein [Chloroflexaceae bacterium]